MTTQHISDKGELVTADQADDEIEQPKQAAQAKNTAPPDPVVTVFFVRNPVVKRNLETSWMLIIDNCSISACK